MPNNQYNSAPSTAKYQGLNNAGKVLQVNQNGIVEPVDIGSDNTKADKVSNAVNNSFAGLDANGNLTDSCLSVVNGQVCITYQKEVDD